MFSTFLTKELSTATNIKDRSNRKNVVRILKMIQSRIKAKEHLYTNGILLYAGIDQYDDEVFHLVEPTISMNQFYYDCGNKFQVDRFRRFFVDVSGWIAFADGEQFLLYQFIDGKFVKKAHKTANLIKRQKKGGQSSLRFSRLAEESRHTYVSAVLDLLDTHCKYAQTIWLFGSTEISKMILQKTCSLALPIEYGGFIEFDLSTISNADMWISYIQREKVNTELVEKIIYYLDTDPDMLDFDPTQKHKMQASIDRQFIHDTKSHLSAELYSRICMFEYVGVKFYRQQVVHVAGEDGNGQDQDNPGDDDTDTDNDTEEERKETIHNPDGLLDGFM